LVDDIWKGLGEQGSFQPVTEQLEWRRWCDMTSCGRLFHIFTTKNGRGQAY